METFGKHTGKDEMKFLLKTSVNPNISVDFAMALGWLAVRWEALGLGDFVIASLKDGDHKAGSQHKQDQPDSVQAEAADIRTWKHWQGLNVKPDGKTWKECGHHSAELLAFARSLQAEGFKVVVHPDWQGDDVTPHLHVARRESFFLRTN